MSWPRVYRIALHLLTAELRGRHGAAMELLFARELERARARGSLHAALAGARGIWDVVRRSAYEHLRRPRGVAPDSRELLHHHATSFGMAFMALTPALLASFISKQLPQLRATGASAATVAEAMVLSVPFTAALTIPMAVFVAVLWQFTRLGADGTLTDVQRERGGLRRLVVPVLGAALGIAALSFVVTAEIVPRANERLLGVLTQRATAPTDRTLTIGELRAAARTIRPATEPVALARLARYEIEVQKKFALPAACVFLTLAAIAIALSVPRGGMPLVIGASVAVFGTYYVTMIAGETLANQLVVPPFVAMWGANTLLLAAASLAIWIRREPRPSNGGGAVVIGR